MPLTIHGKTFDGFDAAVNYVMQWKGISREKAKKYVGYVENAVHGGK